MAGRYENDHAELVNLLSRLEMLQFDRPEVKRLGLPHPFQLPRFQLPHQFQLQPGAVPYGFNHIWYHELNKNCKYLCGSCRMYIAQVDDYNETQREKMFKKHPTKYVDPKKHSNIPFLEQFQKFSRMLHNIYLGGCMPSNETIKNVLVEWKLLKPDVDTLYFLFTKRIENKKVDLSIEIKHIDNLINMMIDYTNHYKALGT